MDQYLSAIIIAIISGIFAVVLKKKKKRQTKQIQNIDKKAAGLAKEKKLKSDLEKSRNELEMTIHQIMLFILDTTMDIMKLTYENGNIDIRDTISQADQLKAQYQIIMNQIKSINHDYEILLDLTQELESSSSSNDRHR